MPASTAAGRSPFLPFGAFCVRLPAHPPGCGPPAPPAGQNVPAAVLPPEARLPEHIHDNRLLFRHDLPPASVTGILPGPQNILLLYASLFLQQSIHILFELLPFIFLSIQQFFFYPPEQAAGPSCSRSPHRSSHYTKMSHHCNLPSAIFHLLLMGKRFLYRKINGRAPYHKKATEDSAIYLKRGNICSSVQMHLLHHPKDTPLIVPRRALAKEQFTRYRSRLTLAAFSFWRRGRTMPGKLPGPARKVSVPTEAPFATRGSHARCWC